VVATATSYLLASYYLLPPLESSAIQSTVERWQQFFIVLAGVVISLLNEALHRARRRADAATLALQRSGTALQQAESRHARRIEGIVNSAMDAIISVDGAQRIVLFNAAAERMFDCAAAEVLGQPLDRFIPERSRGGHAEHMESFRHNGVTSRSMRSLGTLTAVRRDGSEFPIEASISHMEEGGQVFYSVILRDISEREVAQARLQAQLERLSLLDQITRAIAERQDLRSIYQVTANSLEALLPAEFSCVLQHHAAGGALTVGGVGQLSEAWMPELQIDAEVHFDADRLRRCLAGELIYDRDTAALDFPFTRRMASAGLHSLVLIAVRSESRVFGMLVAARRDVAAFSAAECEFLSQLSAHVALAAQQAELHEDLKRAFEQLRRTQQAMLHEERLRALGQMASGIAHDINNALSPAVLYAESLLSQEPLSERARMYVQSIARAVDDVAATVARMREFYRAREPQAPLLPLPLNDLARQVIELSKARWSDMPQRQGHVIEVTTELADRLPQVLGAENEIREALINLVFNAVDAMPEGGRLTVRTRALPAAPGGEGAASALRVALEVGDTGVGMDEPTRLRCLEPFFTTKGDRGTGLGLAMVYGTAQRHGAQIEIDSAPGQGTVVRIVFPVPALEVAAALPPQVERGEPLRILLVDDDPALLRALRSTLEIDGHQLQLANGGKAGIETFREATGAGRSFDVVITDLGMPQIDGRIVAAAVKSLSPATPVILLTGWGQRISEEGDAPAEVDQVLSKPPRLADIRAALAKCMAGRQG